MNGIRAWRAPKGVSRARWHLVTLGLVFALALAACGSSSTAARHPAATATATRHAATATPGIPPTPAVVASGSVPVTLPAARGWTLAGSPGVGAEGHLTAVTALTASDAWAVGQFEGTDGRQHTLTEHWDGTSWSVIASPSPGPRGNILNAVAARAGTDAWAAGGFSDAASVGHPLIQHWDGAAWTTIASPDTGAHTTNAELTGVTALTASDAWAVGYVQRQPDSQTFEQDALIEHWDGHAWSLVAPAVPPAAPFGGTPRPELDAVAALATNDVWAAGSLEGAPLIEHWDGTRWSVVPVATTTQNAGLSSIAAISASDIWAVGPGPFSRILGSCGSGGGVLIAHWDGHTWTSVPAAIPPPSANGSFFTLAAVAASSARDVWAAGGAFAYNSSKSAAYTPVIEHWDGTRWSLVSGPTQVTAYGLAGLAADHAGSVWAVGQSEAANGPGTTRVERWNGAQWASVPSPSPGTLTNTLNGIAAVSANDLWAVGSSDGGTLAEHWDGTAWSVATTPNATNRDNALNAVSATSSSDVWAVGVAGGATGGTTGGVVERYDGARWSLIPDASGGAATFVELRGVAALSTTNVWAVGSEGGPFIEHWDGSAWSRVTIPATAPASIAGFDSDTLFAIAALSANDIWAVGGNPPAGCGGQPPALIMHWDGHAWSIIPNTPQGLLTGVAAVAPNDVWAVGGQLVMHWDGSSWSTVYSFTTLNPSHAFLNAVAGSASNDVWSVGQEFTEHGTIPVVEHWDGHAWSAAQAPTPGLGDNFLNAVVALGATNAWAVGYYSQCAFCGNRQALIEHYAP